MIFLWKEHSGAKLGGPALSSHQREKNLKPSISREMAKPQGRAFHRVAPPLVWKTSHFRNVAVKRISALVSGGGTANQFTGSPVTN